MKADIDKNGKLTLYRDGMLSKTAFCPYASGHKHCKCTCPKLDIREHDIDVCGTKIDRRK